MNQDSATHFCTLFDSNYLTRGLALYQSLRAKCASFKLYVYCFDEAAHEILSELALPGLVTITLAEFESPELLAVKPQRTRGEYCWTCTAHIIRDAIKRFDLEEITYLDADLYFFADPELLLSEFRRFGASTLITEHRYSPRYTQSVSSGIYCVQFMTFRHDDHGMATLNWWCERTLEWCYNRHEEGKFGDQKYLDDWPERFARVHVLQHLGGGVAPWNIQQYQVAKGPSVDGVPVVFYHFHNLTWCEDDSFVLDRYRLNSKTLDYLYRPYLVALSEQLRAVQKIRPDFTGGKSALPPPKKALWQALENKLKGKFHVIR